MVSGPFSLQVVPMSVPWCSSPSRKPLFTRISPSGAATFVSRSVISLFIKHEHAAPHNEWNLLALSSCTVKAIAGMRHVSRPQVCCGHIHLHPQTSRSRPVLQFAGRMEKLSVADPRGVVSTRHAHIQAPANCQNPCVYVVAAFGAAFIPVNIICPGSAFAAMVKL